MTSVVDANILLHAVNRASRQHQPCLEWLTQALNGNSPVAFTWLALTAFIRISTRAGILDSPLKISEAFDCVEDWLNQPPSRILFPGPRHLAAYRLLAEKVGIAGNLTMDAHLAAIALDHEAELISCDADFARFPGLKWFNPATGERNKR